MTVRIWSIDARSLLDQALKRGVIQSNQADELYQLANTIASLEDENLLVIAPRHAMEAIHYVGHGGLDACLNVCAQVGDSVGVERIQIIKWAMEGSRDA